MKLIPLTKGQVAIVDDEDYKRLSRFKWCAHLNRLTNTYIGQRYSHSINKAKYQDRPINITMQEEVIGKVFGQQIDHINGNTLDNRRENLRHCTHQQNCCNRRKRPSQSKYKGVWRNGTNWAARICLNGIRKYLGTYKYEEEAARVYDQAAKQYHGAFARLNFQT